ncbi:hypothetical protein ACHAWF_005036 [Thalassiosira exigua]
MMSNVVNAALRPLLSRRAAEIARGRALPALASVGVEGARLRRLPPPLRRSVHVEAKIESLGIELPAAPLPKANYNIVCLPPGEDVMYVSGHLPIKPDGELITGTLGPDTGGMTVEEGYAAARHCGLNIISTLKAQLGDLDRVEQVVKVRVRDRELPCRVQAPAPRRGRVLGPHHGGVRQAGGLPRQERDRDEHAAPERFRGGGGDREDQAGISDKHRMNEGFIQRDRAGQGFGWKWGRFLLSGIV